MEKKYNNNIMLILLALVFGIGGGMAGEMITRMYILQDAYNVPLFGNVNVPGNVYGGSNLIIDSPKKVIVEQNTKSLEAINSAEKSMVGIYKGLRPKAATSTFDTASQYDLDKPLGQGVVVTSDGWVMSTFIPEEFKKAQEESLASSTKEIAKKIMPEFVAVGNDGKVYGLIDLSINKDLGVSFWRVAANDLLVKQFKKVSEISKGQIAIAVNFQGRSWVTSVSDKYPANLPEVLSSDRAYAELHFVNPLDKDFGSAFVYSLEGDLIALADGQGKIKPISNYFSSLSNLLEKKDVATPYLGINYVDLSRYANYEVGTKNLSEGAMVYPNDKGIAVAKDSPADKAGLKKGDIIRSVKATKIDKDNKLSDVVAEIKPGEVVNISFDRGVGKCMSMSPWEENKRLTHVEKISKIIVLNGIE